MNYTHATSSGVPDSLQAGPIHSASLPSTLPLLPPLLQGNLLIPEGAPNPASTTMPTGPVSELQVLGIDQAL